MVIGAQINYVKNVQCESSEMFSNMLGKHAEHILSPEREGGGRDGMNGTGNTKTANKTMN